MTTFRRDPGGVRVEFDAGEAGTLRELVGQVRALLYDRAEQVGGPSRYAVQMDPAFAGIDLPAGGPAPGLPDDPVLARLFPDARSDDPKAAREHRRLTEDELRRGKLDDADEVLDRLPADGGAIVLDDEAADAWLRALNDVRLAMGTRLDVTERTRLPRRPRTPDQQALMLYFWLGWLQESLLEVMTGRA